MTCANRITEEELPLLEENVGIGHSAFRDGYCKQDCRSCGIILSFSLIGIF